LFKDLVVASSCSACTIRAILLPALTVAVLPLAHGLVLLCRLGSASASPGINRSFTVSSSFFHKNDFLRLPPALLLFAVIAALLLLRTVIH